MSTEPFPRVIGDTTDAFCNPSGKAVLIKLETSPVNGTTTLNVLFCRNSDTEITESLLILSVDMTKFLFN